jgi:Domain of unknown function (DUF5666)
MRRLLQRGRVAVTVLIVIGTWLPPGNLVPASGAPADVVRDGIIAAVGADGLSIAFAASPTPATAPVHVSAETRVVRRQKTTLAAVKPGDYLAVTSKRGVDGTLTAVSINIFPPEYRGRVREGQFPMESGNVMTNATVMEFAERVEGRTLFLKYRDGSTAIAVPPTTEIHRLLVGRLGELRKGMHVVVRGMVNPDGSIVASSITADEP